MKKIEAKILLNQDVFNKFEDLRNYLYCLKNDSSLLDDINIDFIEEVINELNSNIIFE